LSLCTKFKITIQHP